MIEKIKNWKQKLGKWFYLILVILLIVVWRIIGGSTKSIKVQSTVVSRGDVVQSISTSGTVKADRYVQLTFPTGGKIVAVGVKPGQKVNKGQFIAQVDAVALNAAYQNALNTYRGTQAAVDLEHDNDKNNGAAETFAQKSVRTAAEVANDNAYNGVLAAQDNLKNAVLFAPFAGVIDMVSPTSPGINVLPGAANYTIVDPTSVYFDAEVEETDLPMVSVGQKVNVKLDAYPDANLEGEVSVIGLVAFTSSTGGNAYHLRITLPDNSAQKYKVGMQGDSDIILGTVSGVVKVATSAIFSESEKNYVWIVYKGKAKKTEVELGAASDTETEIKSGVSEGQTIIDNPPSNIKDGARVQI